MSLYNKQIKKYYRPKERPFHFGGRNTTTRYRKGNIIHHNNLGEGISKNR